MKKLMGLAFLFFFVMLLVMPLAIAEDMEQMAAPEEEVASSEDSGEGVVTGTVVDLNMSAGTISIKISDGGEKTFSVVDGETILWKGIEDIELSSINKGEEAEIGYYTDESGKMIASWVDVLVEEPTTPATVSDTEME